MTSKPTTEATDGIDDPEVAFAAMGRKLAGLTAAVDGFAVRQQELHARDYGPDLARLLASNAQLREGIDTLGHRPAMALTPEALAAEITAAGTRVREADHAAWEAAHHGLDRTIGSLETMLASHRTARDQTLWLAIAAAAALVLGFLFGTTLPAAIDRAMPESWHWPEDAAADLLQRDGWSSGVRLLQVSDPAQWRAMRDAARLAHDNADGLAQCRKDAVAAKRAVACRIEVGPPQAR